MLAMREGESGCERIARRTARNRSELMLAQFSVSALPSMLFVALRDRKSLQAILALSPGGVASFFGLAWSVYLTANYLQIIVNRTLGTIRHSAASGLRLVATCLGSAILLHELPTSGCELAGLALVRRRPPRVPSSWLTMRWSGVVRARGARRLAKSWTWLGSAGLLPMGSPFAVPRLVARTLVRPCARWA